MKLPAILPLALAKLLAWPAVAQVKKGINEFTTTAEDKSTVIEKGDDSFKIRCAGLDGHEVIFEGEIHRQFVDCEFNKFWEGQVWEWVVCHSPVFSIFREFSKFQTRLTT